ncbi:MAG: DNA-binding protein [Clostridium sp.]
MAIDKDKNTRIMITIPIDIKEKLQEKAKKENRTMTNYVMTLVLKDLED